MNPEEILRQAQVALQPYDEDTGTGGYTLDEVNAVIAQKTDYPNFFALKWAVESAADFVRSEELKEIGEHPVRSFLGSLAQGLSLGGIDELIGMANPRLGKNLRRAQELRAEHAPGADIAAQIGGGLLTGAAPIRGASAVAQTMAPGIMRGALTGAARGAATGAAGGAASGALFARPGERVEGARTGAAFGAAGGGVLGAPMGAMGGLFGAASGRGARVADRMVELANRPRAHMGLRGVVNEINENRAVVQQNMYRPLSAANTNVDHPAIESVLTTLGADPSFRNVALPRRLRSGYTRTAARRGRGGVIIQRPAALPSFEDLQEVRNNLRRHAYNKDGTVANSDAVVRLEEMTQAMNEAFGDTFIEADAAWSALARQEEAAEKGWRMYNHPADEIELERDKLFKIGPDALNTFDDTRLARIVDDMNTNYRGTVALLRNYMDAGESTKRKVASLFPGGMNGSAFEQLERMLSSEATNAAIAEFFNGAVKSGAIGATGGAISGGLFATRGER